MIRKWLKSHLPDREQLTRHPHLAWLGVLLHEWNLWHLNRRSVSKGVAMGVLAAFIPLPIQMICAAILAILIRGNVFIAMAMTWITNPITFIPINYTIYLVGKWVTGSEQTYKADNFIDWDSANLSVIIDLSWEWFTSLGKPFLVGLPIVAISCSALSYLLVQLFWKAFIYVEWQYRKKHREKNKIK